MRKFGAFPLRARVVIAAAIAIVAVFTVSLDQYVRAAEADNVSGWAWNATAGWLSANSENCLGANRAEEPDPCARAGRAYGVAIADDGALRGYAWSEVVGWMCVGATCATSGGTTPDGGWRARVDAVTGSVSGWAKVLAFGEHGWVSFSCENTGTCNTIAYRTNVDMGSGQFGGHAWNGAQDGSALGWISWRPTFGGVTTTWRPVPRCTAGSLPGQECRADVQCTGTSGELCCPAGQSCGRCAGVGGACGSDATCDAGALCCRPGILCGRCAQTGAACGSDAECGGARDSCCPPGAVCGVAPPDVPPGDGGDGGGDGGDGGSSVPVVPVDPIGLCSGTGDACVTDAQCAGQQVCDTTTGSCTETGIACQTYVGGGSSCAIGACADIGRCAGADELCAITANCSGGGACEPIRACVADAKLRCGDDAGCAVAGGRCIERPGRCTNTGAACRSDAECGPDGRCDASVGRCTGSGTSCVADRECPAGQRCASVGVCATSLDPCVDGADCGGDTCDRGIGLCTANGPDERPIPCRTDATCRPLGAEVTCAKQLGRCVQTNRLCAVDANCPIIDAKTGERDRCGKLFLPWIQTQYGSIYSRGNIGSAKTPPPPSGSTNATYCILAGGRIVNFLSASSSCGTIPGYTLPSVPSYAPAITARIDVRGILSGRYGALTALPKDFPAHLGGKVYLVDGKDLTVGGVRFQSGAGLFVIRGGNLRITGDLRYAPAQSVTRTRDLASPAWLILKGAKGEGGDVVIDPAVREIVGAFYAEGEIRTGSSGSVAMDEPLVIRGVLIARRFLFERLAGSAEGGAEQIIADGRVLANTPPGLGDLVKGLPVIRSVAP